MINTPSIIYADLEPLGKRINRCKHNSEKSSIINVGEHIHFGYSMSFNGTKDKYKVQEVETVWKYFVNLKGARNQNNQLWKGESNRINKLTGGIAWKDKNLLQLRKRKFEYKYINDKNYRKVKDHCHYTSKYEGPLHSIYNLKYGILKKIPVAFLYL